VSDLVLEQITELSRVTGVSGASITALVKKWKLKPTKTGNTTENITAPRIVSTL